MKIKISKTLFSNILLARIIAALIIISATSSLGLFTPPISIASDVPVFSHASTAEADIKAYLQSNFDNMSNEITFRVKGDSTGRLFFDTDQNGDFIFTDFAVRIFREQISVMHPYNPSGKNLYNGYTKWAFEMFSVSVPQIKHMNGTIVEFDITYSIKWRDGKNALAARNEVISHAKAFLNSDIYKSKTTDYEKIKAINTYICETFQYDYRLFVEDEQDHVIYSAYQMINDTGTGDGHPIGGYPRGVCQAYSMYGYVMLREAGFSVITIDGEAGGGPHAWNMVKIGNNWYHIDFTWNDPVSSNVTEPEGFEKYSTRQAGAGTVSEAYLLRSDESISVTHSWEKVSEGYAYPVALFDWAEEGVTPPDIDPEGQPNPAIPTAAASPSPSPSPSPLPTPTLSPTPAITPVSSPESFPPDKSDQKSSSLPEERVSSEIPVTTPGDEVSADPETERTITGYSPVTKEDSEIMVIISGTLKDPYDSPLPGYNIELYASSMTQKTSATGRFEFSGVKVGNYRIYVKDENGNEIANLPVIIAFGNETRYRDGEIITAGGKINMDLVLDGDNLYIRCLYSESSDSGNLIVIGIVGLALILASLFAVIFSKKKEGEGSYKYLD